MGKEIAEECFQILRKEYFENKNSSTVENVTGKPYFETNRKFSNLVPTYYKRSAAPRKAKYNWYYMV